MLTFFTHSRTTHTRARTHTHTRHGQIGGVSLQFYANGSYTVIEFFIRFLRPVHETARFTGRATRACSLLAAYMTRSSPSTRAWSTGGCESSRLRSPEVSWGPIDFLPLRSLLDVARRRKSVTKAGAAWRGIRLNYGPRQFRLFRNLLSRRSGSGQLSRAICNPTPPCSYFSLALCNREGYARPLARTPSPSLQLWPLITFLFVEFPDR